MNSLRKALLSLAAVAGACSMSPAAMAQMTQAAVQQGQLSGTKEGGVTTFLGVPFAASPTGERRWKVPAPATSWKGVRKADTLPSSCQQGVTPNGFGPWTHEYVVTNAVSEDCLYLNVWTPAQRAGEKLPVMVWIHGGGFTGGSASVPIYDGAKLAEKGIVVIAINYRLGAYGFLAHPELTAESPAHASGNYGLLDQIAALQWIKANAAAFGGDPDRVTIAGQSAGAMSVHHLIASPLAKGLFAQAIAQSGSGTGVNPGDRTAAEKQGLSLMQAAGVASLADLRKLTPAQLEAAQGKMGQGAGFAPIVDGLVLPDASFAGANTNDTPILTGMTSDEMTGLNPNFGKATPAVIQAQLERSYGQLAPEFARLYPAASDAEANATAGALARDRGLASMALWAQQRQGASRQPVYAYLWTHPEPGPDAARYGAFHSSEIPYVFDTLDASPERPFTDLDRQLAAQMGDYWVNFVKTGNPNGSGLAAWPAYTPEGRQIVEIGSGTKARAVLPPNRLEAFRRHAQQGGQLGLF
ncbi:MAG: carboxylesterase family protein [Porphyrobacter sp.]|nr:carboxylesterase family protein [Porphyrobacter sp.]